LNEGTEMRSLLSLAFLIALNATLWCSGSAFGQYLPPEVAPAPELKENDAAREAIRDLLQTPGAQAGEAAEPAGRGSEPAKSSGDPVLDDVLEIIRRRGSVLEGSTLDPQNETESVIIDVPSLAAPNEAVAPGDAGDAKAVYHVSEQLLRAARLLEALPNPDASRIAMVRDLRSQATRLLIQTLSRDSISPPPALNRTR
jgi:hypothetical protein